MKKLNKKGFSLVELIIVIAVIAILAAVLIPTFSNMIAKANESAVLQAARSAYEDILARDLADGVVDGKENSNQLVNKIGSATELTGSQEYENVELTVNSKATNYELFEYTDSSKKLKATFNGNEWKVESTATTTD